MWHLKTTRFLTVKTWFTGYGHWWYALCLEFEVWLVSKWFVHKQMTATRFCFHLYTTRTARTKTAGLRRRASLGRIGPWLTNIMYSCFGTKQLRNSCHEVAVAPRRVRFRVFVYFATLSLRLRLWMTWLFIQSSGIRPCYCIRQFLLVDLS